jgi:adenosylcobinamide kinase / adenosylcobinamide-phosphate guanylyltransferase
MSRPYRLTLGPSQPEPSLEQARRVPQPFSGPEVRLTDIILVTGGMRSGKSHHAERLTLSLGAKPVYIATAEIIDGEMNARIAAHRARRGETWGLHEASLDLAEALRRTDGNGPRLIDCLTIWLSNLLHYGRDWQRELEGLCAALHEQSSPVVMVTSEVGFGIVPDNALTRQFCDAAGMVNQRVARVAGRVDLVTAGIPLRLK